MDFCQFFKQKRQAIGTVRQFASDNDYDAAYISRLENGITMPPKDSAKLEKLGLSLGITKGSEEWQEFIDLAAIAKNELPDDLRDNKRIVSVLPAFYRTLRKDKLDEDEASKLLELIKSSGKEE